MKKNSDKDVVWLRLPVGMLKKIDKLAVEEKRSRTGQVEFLLEKALADGPTA